MSSNGKHIARVRYVIWGNDGNVCCSNSDHSGTWFRCVGLLFYCGCRFEWDFRCLDTMEQSFECIYCMEDTEIKRTHRGLTSTIARSLPLIVVFDAASGISKLVLLESSISMSSELKVWSSDLDPDDVFWA